MTATFPITGQTVDLSKIEALPAKTSLALFNQFIIRTVSHLNKFVSEIDERMNQIEYQVEKVEIAVALLNKKLSSLPKEIVGDFQINARRKLDHQSSLPQETPALQPQFSSTGPPPPPPPPLPPQYISLLSPDTQGGQGEASPPKEPQSDEQVQQQQQPTSTVDPEVSASIPRYGCEHPNITEEDRVQYNKYIRMYKFGVPKVGLRQKMMMDGVDPDTVDRIIDPNYIPMG